MTGEEYARMKRDQRIRRRYDRLKAEGRCTQCGGQDERTLAGHTRCEACNSRAYRTARPKTVAEKTTDAQRLRERRQAWRNSGKCGWCGAEDYMTQHGKPLCISCLRKRGELAEAYKHGNASENRKRRRDRFREAGMCTNCGKNRPEPGRMQCTDCLVAERIRTRRRRARRV